MGIVTVSRNIAASPAVVFDAISQIENFRQIVTGITNVEFLTEHHHGLGARFTETRDWGGRIGVTTLECTEYERPTRVRMVTDESGAIWDTTYTVEPDGEGARLHMEMEDRPHKLLAKIMNPLIRGMVTKAVTADMDAVKEWCEAKG